jgi:hypothetical protein
MSKGMMKISREFWAKIDKAAREGVGWPESSSHRISCVDSTGDQCSISTTGFAFSGLVHLTGCGNSLPLDHGIAEILQFCPFCGKPLIHL